MNGLADEGAIVLGGPAGQGERSFLLVFRAASAGEIVARLDADPWTRDGRLAIRSIDRWEIVLGEDPA